MLLSVAWCLRITWCRMLHKLSGTFLAIGRPVMFDPSLFLPDRHDALQAPAHRWLRCQYLQDCGLLPTALDDALTQTAYAFCRAWESCRDDVQRQRLARASSPGRGRTSLSSWHDTATSGNRSAVTCRSGQCQNRGDMQADPGSDPDGSRFVLRCTLVPEGPGLHRQRRHRSQGPSGFTSQRP